jgi:hypothetical protein
MPFQDDTGITLDEHRGPLWSVFAIFGSQLERLILLNLGWALQLVPAMAALILAGLPIPVRVLMVVYTGMAVPPATAVMYGMCSCAADEDMLHIDLLTEVFKDMAWPGLRTLAPLLGSLGLVAWLAQQANAAGLFPVSALLQIALLIMLVTANYWGPLLIVHPDRPAHELFAMALRLVWYYPAPTALLSLVVLVTGVIGAISIGGLFLAIPVIIALLQIQMFRRLTRRGAV